MLSEMGVYVNVNYIYHITPRKGKWGKRLKVIKGREINVHICYEKVKARQTKLVLRKKNKKTVTQQQLPSG